MHQVYGYFAPTDAIGFRVSNEFNSLSLIWPLPEAAYLIMPFVLQLTSTKITLNELKISAGQVNLTGLGTIRDKLGMFGALCTGNTVIPSLW